jgi:Xaa-Pro dipeptidase
MAKSIRKELPEITVTDVYDHYFEIFAKKSEEEIAMLRKAALVSEVVCEEYLNACRPGNTVADVEMAALNMGSRNGVLLRCAVGSGPDGGRGVDWLGAGLRPPVIKKGDLVYSELFAWVGPVHCQSQICVSIGEPSEKKKKLAALAREAYEIGVETIRPGITFGEVAEAMNRPNLREGAWKWMPNVHTLNPIEAVDIHPQGMLGPRGLKALKERIGEVSEDVMSGAGGRSRRFELVLQEGWTLELEAQSCFGPTYMQIGGTVLVTKNGCEELNTIPTRMVVVPS